MNEAVTQRLESLYQRKLAALKNRCCTKPSRVPCDAAMNETAFLVAGVFPWK